MRGRLTHHAHHDRHRRRRNHTDRHARVSRALERRLQEQADGHEQRDIARKGHPLKRYVGDDELDSARHHRKQTFIEHVFPVFIHAKLESYTWLMVTHEILFGERKAERLLRRHKTPVRKAAVRLQSHMPPRPDTQRGLKPPHAERAHGAGPPGHARRRHLRLRARRDAATTLFRSYACVVLPHSS